MGGFPLEALTLLGMARSDGRWKRINFQFIYEKNRDHTHLAFFFWW